MNGPARTQDDTTTRSGDHPMFGPHPAYSTGTRLDTGVEPGK